MPGDDTSDEPVTIDVTATSSDDSSGNAPAQPEIDSAVMPEVDIAASRPSLWPLVFVALAIGAWWYFSGEEDEA